jgi:hypothetical protein
MNTLDRIDRILKTIAQDDDTPYLGSTADWFEYVKADVERRRGASPDVLAMPLGLHELLDEIDGVIGWDSNDTLPEHPHDNYVGARVRHIEETLCLEGPYAPVTMTSPPYFWLGAEAERYSI